ncbi:FMN-dependent NADH-azoreductase [Marinobacterium arenosum]|uniref:FMN-dependent NADH-azoreductase n=1 Tax=Marinobacterium arenosum TaxID=2862496 RepID=UPI001C97A7E1|nr:NAD(P)H-dependent oxidoreductase [Marinobacterium arenosum]MBY4675030.1 NAD(P)H-dependent oxidoreductase [Marinobacterium arenosum]
MKTVLKIDASARTLDLPEARHRSLSRSLARHFCDRLATDHNKVNFIHRDVGLMPPAFISEDWIAAVFRPEEQRSDAQKALLALSDQLIDEVAQADLILISSPMYNYGMPACLKAWFDQVVRINKTFDFDLARGDFPLAPTLSGKTLVLLTSCGEFGFTPGGIRAEMNHLGPHIRTLSKYLGVERFHEIGIEYQEFGDQRHRHSIEQAYRSVDRLVAQLTGLRRETVC